MAKHARRHGKPHVVDLGDERDRRDRRLHSRGFWADPERRYRVRHDTADAFVGAFAATIRDYCCQCFERGQRVPEQLDRVALAAYSSVFLFHKGKPPRLTLPAEAYEDAQRRIAALVEVHKRRDAAKLLAREAEEREAAKVRVDPRFVDVGCQTRIDARAYGKMERDLRAGAEAKMNLEHNYMARHTTNLTALRMRKWGRGCLQCEHCQKLAERMAQLDKFRYTGKCVACLPAREVWKLEVPDEFNPYLEEIKRLDAHIEHSLELAAELDEILEDYIGEIDAARDDPANQTTARDDAIRSRRKIRTRARRVR